MTPPANEHVEGRGRRIADRRHQRLAFPTRERRTARYDRRESLRGTGSDQSHRAEYAGQPFSSLNQAVIQKWLTVATAAPLPKDDSTALQLLLRGGVWSLARYCKMSQRTMRRRCAKAGVRLAQYRHDLRRELVIQLLSSDLRLAEIAARVGFASSQTLARFIKKELGATATTLRRRIS